MLSGEHITYAEALERAEEAKQLAEQLRQRELETVVAEIKEKIRLYGITAKDLGFEGPSQVIEMPAKQKTDKRSIVQPKYRSGSGDTWSGRGGQPAWISKHIEAGGKLEDFLLEKDSATS